VTTQRLHLHALAALLCSACYTADFDPDIAGVFACEEDVDCALGQACAAGVCVSASEENGPVLQLASPSQLDIYALGLDTDVQVVVAGRDLVLSGEDPDDPLAGYIEVELDGAVIDTIVEGDLEDGIEIDAIPLPQAPGLHHVRVVSRHLDGDEFVGDRAVAHAAFWVDNGEEQVGILTPPPGTKIPLGDGENLKVEVASLNFTFVNPGFIGPDEVDLTGLGYVHLYVDANVPSCLPGCNFDYQTSIIPAGLSRVNRIIAEEGVLLPDGVGTVKLQIVAQSPDNSPYYRDAGTGEVVYYSVAIQSVASVAP
jgi:hypothetical protein